MRDMNLRSGTNAALLQKLEQAAVALINTAYLNILSRLGLREQEQSPTAAARGTLEFAQITVRAGDSATEFRQQPGFKIR